MVTLQLSLHLLCIVAGSLAAPDPGRVPKVYNALITSNQNLEPSKAYPVYQPVLHDAAFGFPYHPAFFYGGEIPLSNGLVPLPAPIPRPQLGPAAEFAPPALAAPAPETPAPEPADPAQESESKAPAPEEQPPESSRSEEKPAAPLPAAPPSPPQTESPIPLNEFGLPPQVLPLGKFDPYRGFNHIGPLTYPYPGIRYYDPYDPYNFNPYVNFAQVYRPLPSEYSPGLAPSKPELPVEPPKPQNESPAVPPPSDSSDLNVLNYSSKDPAIPNVPPPPLPKGGLKSDDE